MDPDSSSLAFIEAKETVDDLLSVQNKEEDSPNNKEESSTSPLIESEGVKELPQINPSEHINTSASEEEVIDADPISYKLPNEEKIQVYEPNMSMLKEQILTDVPETSTPKDKAWINETDTLNKKNESRTGKSIPKRRKRTLSQEEKYKMSTLKEKILTDEPGTSTPKHKAWINETDTLNKKNESQSGKSIPKRRKRTQSLEEKYSANWHIVRTQRKKGTKKGSWDSKYYLKTDKTVMCRSLKSIETYEMTGEHDGPKGKGKKKKITEEVVKNMGDSKVKKRKRKAEKRMTTFEKFLAEPRDDYVLNLNRAIVPYQSSDSASPIETFRVPSKFYVESSLLHDFFYTNDDAPEAPKVIVSEEEVEDIFEEVIIETGDAADAREVVIPEEVEEGIFEGLEDLVTLFI